MLVRRCFYSILIVFLVSGCKGSDGDNLPHKDGQMKEANQMRVISYNIRFANPGDGENAWSNRKQMVASMIRIHQADIVGIQEALKDQIDYLEKIFPALEWFGVGRDDGQMAGEFSPVFYRKKRFKLLDHSTFWLSENPDLPGSMGWDAAHPRLVTWGKFKDKQSGKAFFLFNTHFDHAGVEARINSARLLREKVETIAEGRPVLVTGDFNCTPDSKPMRILNENSEQNESKLTDVLEKAKYPHYGPTGTFNGFNLNFDTQRRIDYVLVNKYVNVLTSAVLTDQWHNRFPSDHFPVMSDIVFD